MDYSALKTNEILPFVTTWIDNLEGITLSEIIRERQIPHDLNYTWNLITIGKKRLMNTQNRLVDARGRGWQK